MTNTPLSKALDHVFKIEGGYSDHAHDRGGKTNYGITHLTLARAIKDVLVPAHTRIEDLTREQAEIIYEAYYWKPLRLDEIAYLSYPIALELFDTGVNMGLSRAGKFLQRALNGFNRQGTIHPDLILDSSIGPVTVSALTKFLELRGKPGEYVLLRALNGQQVVAYFDITENDPSQEEFLYGWILNRVGGSYGVA